MNIRGGSPHCGRERGGSQTGRIPTEETAKIRESAARLQVLEQEPEETGGTGRRGKAKRGFSPSSTAAAQLGASRKSEGLL